MLVPDSRPGRPGREVHRPRRTCPTKHKAAWLILVFPGPHLKTKMETDTYFLRNMFLAWEDRHFLRLHVLFLLGAFLIFFSSPCFFFFSPPLCTIYRTSAPSPLTLFGLLRSIKQRFLCNSLFFGHFFAGLNFRTVELLPWQQKSFCWDSCEYSISYLVSRVLGTLMAPSPTAVLPRWWGYSGVATLQHHQGVGPVDPSQSH